jgi:2-keto-4-pentenoate hydratase/2-oxohepta-3-ene-1,7-dioic acid hydratase in catechol pathway
MNHVCGCTIINDVTARDLQARHRQWQISKLLDTLGPMLQWAVTRDEIDLETTQVRCWVNGELRQNQSTKALMFDVPTPIETISRALRWCRVTTSPQERRLARALASSRQNISCRAMSCASRFPG